MKNKTKIKLISYDAWAEKYKPLNNRLSPRGETPYDGKMFETYGEQMRHVNRKFTKDKTSQHIWTLVEEDGESFIVAGMRYVNRLGYFITRKKWDDPLIETVKA